MCYYILELGLNAGEIINSGCAILKPLEDVNESTD